MRAGQAAHTSRPDSPPAGPSACRVPPELCPPVHTPHVITDTWGQSHKEDMSPLRCKTLLPPNFPSNSASIGRTTLCPVVCSDSSRPDMHSSPHRSHTDAQATSCLPLGLLASGSPNGLWVTRISPSSSLLYLSYLRVSVSVFPSCFLSAFLFFFYINLSLSVSLCPAPQLSHPLRLPAPLQALSAPEPQPSQHVPL